jgi:WhiB family redox-sensing transcriptional regulator
MESIKIDYNWQQDAACKGISLESYDLFYVSTGKSSKKETNNICGNCPVVKDCLSHALKYEEYGYWGGTTSGDRKRMRKELGIKLIEIDYSSLIDNVEEQDSFNSKEDPCELDW